MNPPKEILKILKDPDLPSHLKEDAEGILEYFKKEKKRKDFIVERLIEDKKITENFLNKTVRDLEAKNDELFHALIDKEQVNEKLLTINKELEEFAYIISHDLQEPLRTILNFVSLLLKRCENKLDEESQIYLDFISQSSIRMSNQIRAILEYSRIGKEGEKKMIDCHLLVQNVVNDLSSAIKNKQAQIYLNPLPLVYGNLSELYSLFHNLILNSLKYAKEDVPPQIWINCKKEDNYFLFSIRDNGIGIKPEHHERIFVIFQRLHSLTDLEGAGIGLSRCKKIIEVHSGRLWVESTYREGTTFYFTLPRKTIDE